MCGWAKALVALVVVAVVAVIVLGYFGVIGVPMVSPSVQSYPSTTEIRYEDVSHLIPQSSKYPSIDDMMQYGLTVHVYGTDDSGSVVRGYYDALTADWEEVVSESGSGWSWGIWRSYLYGFGLAVYDSAQVRRASGYNTVFVTVDGPASAWAPIISRVLESRT